MSVVDQTTGVSYSTLSGAIAGSSANDVIQISAGSYVENFPDITHNLTIEAVGGLAYLSNPQPDPPNGRAVINVPGDLNVSLTLNGLDISGAVNDASNPPSSGGANGSGILFEFGNGALDVENCHIHNNEEGILTGSADTASLNGMTVTIANSEIDNNGVDPSNIRYGFDHNIYTGSLTQLTVIGSYIHDALGGHEIKTHADNTIIMDSLIQDGPTASTSYSVDLEVGGVVTIENNVIEKGPNAQNDAFIHYGGAVPTVAPNSSLTISGNTVIDDKASNQGPFVYDQAVFTNGGPIVVPAISGNTFFGPNPDNLLAGPGFFDVQSGAPYAAINTFLPINDEPAVVVGSGGNDTIDLAALIGSTSTPAFVFGLGGNDTIDGTGMTSKLCIVGGAGNDTLKGGAGNDTLNGGAGNDVYYVDNAADKVNEAAGQGTDTVYASVSYALQAGQEVEFLRANAGTTGLSLTGNALNNTIVGGAGNDTLKGGVGNDTLNGGAGNDTLMGGAGADVMSGGAGNDVYYVDNAADKVNEAAGQGTDTVYASVSYALQAGQEVEFLRANAGTTGLSLTGNALNNTIVGGAGNDTLKGGVGNDTLNGGAGNDTLMGGAGADVMSGGAGNDVYYVDNAADKVNEAAGQGTDTVYASVSYALQAGQEVEFLRANAGTTGLSLTGNALNNTIVGGAGNDTLKGGAGNDTLNGGAGNDTLMGGAGADVMSGGAGNDVYYVDNAADKVNEAAGQGTDTVYASVSYALQAGQEVEFLRANAGTTGLSLTGNALNNTIVGGAGNDTLKGGAGNDTLKGGAGADVMSGGAGNDVYYVDNAADKVNEAAGQGTDTVYASVSYALQAGQEVEFLRANAGTTGLSLTGNALNNTIVGGAGNDTLKGGVGNDTLNGGAGNDTLMGGAGADVMSGGAGNDVYYVDNAADKVNEAAGQGTDTVYASVSYALQAGQEVEFLRANAGTTGLSLTGNALNNTIVGGAGNDTLKGGAGNDTLNGGAGNDTLMGGAGADVMSGGAGNDVYYVDNAADKVNEAAGQGTDTVYASVSYALQAGQEVEFLRANAGTTGLSLTGNALNNTIVGGAGNDTLKGGAGNDTLKGGAGADVMSGGAGNDVYYVDNAADKVNEAAGQGTDTVYASVSYALQAGQEVEFLRANAGTTGLSLTGNALNNTIVGGAGNDTLKGGVGADVLTGGGGADTFKFTSLADSTVAVGGRDTIMDFVSGDKIDLHLIDANASLASDQAFSFIGTNAFSGVAGQLHYAAPGGNTLISGDVNGDKIADFSILVSGAHAFGASDFVL